MSPSQLIVVQSIALPFGLSGLLLWLGPNRYTYKVIGSALIWLVASAWIIGLPNVPPVEAIDWLWLLLAASYPTAYINQRHTQWITRMLIFTVALIAVAWPIMYYQPTVMLLGELVAVIAAAGILFNRLQQTQATTPALALTINSVGLALASSLSGSLLLGQLTAALAAVSGWYAVAEVLNRLHKSRFSLSQALIWLPVYLALLTIARLYAELPLSSTALLLISPIIATLTQWRHAWLANLALSAGAVGLVLLDGDNTTYY